MVGRVGASGRCIICTRGFHVAGVGDSVRARVACERGQGSWCRLLGRAINVVHIGSKDDSHAQSSRCGLWIWAGRNWGRWVKCAMSDHESGRAWGR